MPEPQAQASPPRPPEPPPQPPEPARGISRRQFTARAAGALVALGAAGAAGYEINAADGTVTVDNPYAKRAEPDEGSNARLGPAPGTPGSGLERFVTRPDLLPPHINLNELAAAGTPPQSSPRFIALTPVSDGNFDGSQRGPMLIDRRGRLVWFQPINGSAFDFNIQSYRGRPTLTWWQGTVVQGHGIGTAIFADDRYRTIASIPSRNGVPIDIHELTLTPQGTALVSSFPVADTDLTAVGGEGNGQVLAGHALEIDVRTGKVLFDWNSLDHVGIEESYAPYTGTRVPYDYFHLNSISPTEDGNLLISARHTWCIYKISRSTGAVIWRMNGKRSDFQLAPDARFSWQHDARQRGSQMTVFDNANHNGNPVAQGSRALLLNVAERARRVTLERAYQDPARFSSQAEGNVQMLPGGNVFVAWGFQPYLSEFASDGKLLSSGQFQSAARSYRAFLVDWVGHPGGRPAVVATANPVGGFVVYASWNGATEIDHWTVLAGPNPQSLEPVGAQPWSGFETAIAVNTNGPLFVAVAYDRNGTELGRSEVA
ncbi:MAG: arylsulfotransferase family protein [Solirubrobacteraceae bacterium]